MKPIDFNLLPVLLAVLMATLLIDPSDGQIVSPYNHPSQVLRSNSTNPFVAYSSAVDLERAVKPVMTTTNSTKVPVVPEVGPAEEPVKSETATVTGEGTTIGQGIAEESATVQAEDGVTEEDLSEEGDEEVEDENSATEEVDETKEE